MKYKERLPAYLDRGCPRATDYLGVQSHCVECPFERCLLEDFRGEQHSKKMDRDKTIRERYKRGVTVEALAEEFGVGIRTIHSVLRSE